MKNSQMVRTVKYFAKQPYAWPGGYPLFALTDDGSCLCSKCVRENFGIIGRSTRDKLRDGWRIEGVSINYEDQSLYCSNCDAQIKSAYE